MKVAIDTISDFLFSNEMTVYIVIFDKAAYQISEKLFKDIAEYIDDNYVDEHTDSRREQMRSLLLDEEMIDGIPENAEMLAPIAKACMEAPPASTLAEALS